VKQTQTAPDPPDLLQALPSPSTTRRHQLAASGSPHRWGGDAPFVRVLSGPPLTLTAGDGGRRSVNRTLLQYPHLSSTRQRAIHSFSCA